MTTHLRARAFQAGALLALVGGILVGAPAAAMADDPNVTIDDVSTDIAAGGSTNLKYTVTNQNDVPTPITITINSGDMSCSGQCGAVVPLAAGASVSRTARLTAPQVDAGQTKTINLQINANAAGDDFTASQQLKVHGADKPKTVRQISGKVKDSNGKAIAGANVGIRDASNRQYDTLSNADGGYAFTSSDSSPIGTGSIIVGAAKDGFKAVTVTVQGGADKSVNVPLTLTSLTASPSASPSASASASAAPSDEASEDAEPTEEVSPANTLDANAASKDEGGSSTLFIILGGLLVAAGIGAIVLVLMRRKSADDPDDPDDPNGPVGGGPSGPVPPSQGRFNTPDATRVGAPMGGLTGVGANDATMVASLSEAPTMLHRAVPAEDEFPDPYGAPAVTPGNYAGPGGWGTTPAAAAPAAGGTYGGSQYGAPNQYGAAPAQPAGGYDDDGYGAGQYRPATEEAYGAYSGQYGGGAAAEQQRFDEPTGMYRPEPQQAAGYDRGYDQGGYDAQPGYDAAPGYDATPGYEAPAPGYEAPAPGYGGYRGGQEPGQSTGAYGGGYPAAEPEYPPAPPARGGYQAGGYQGGGYGGAAEPADEQGGYGSWNAPGGGIDSGNAYGPPAGGGGPAATPYGQRGDGGYGGGSGYGEEPAGYDQRGGYGRPEGGYEQGGHAAQPGGGRGYGAEQGGYYGGEQPESGGRHGGQPRQQPPPESSHPGQRRPLDWLDD